MSDEARFGHAVRCPYVSVLQVFESEQELAKIDPMGAVEYLSEYSTLSVCSQTTNFLMEMVARGGIEPPTRGFSVGPARVTYQSVEFAQTWLEQGIRCRISRFG
jgi:hypothetical protein